MSSDQSPAPLVLVFFTGEFKRNLRQLAKKYRRIRSDIQPILDGLEHGQTPGDYIPGVSFEVYKVRAKNTDSTKGKRGGYRIIYQRTPDTSIILISIYSKTEQSDISVQEIREIIHQYETEQNTPARQEILPDTNLNTDP